MDSNCEICHILLNVFQSTVSLILSLKYFSMHLLRLKTYTYIKTVSNFFFFFKQRDRCFRQRERQWMFLGLTSCNTTLWRCLWKEVETICRSKNGDASVKPSLQQASEPQTLRCTAIRRAKSQHYLITT